MLRTRRTWTPVAVAVVVAALGALAAGAARAGSVVVLPRPGQVGVSLGYQYGTLLKGGDVGDVFGSGPGLGVRVRYRMRYERAFGLTFEKHGCDLRSTDKVYDIDLKTEVPADSSIAYKRLGLYLYGVEFSQMFGTRTKTVKMVSVGAGLAHPAILCNDGEYAYPWADGSFLAVGVGVERFFWQSMAFDIGARYNAIFLGGSVNHDVQAHVGVIFYASL